LNGNEGDPALFSAFMFVWVGMGFVGFFVFYRSRNAALKERWHRSFVLGSAVVFAVWALLTGLPASMLLFLVPALALVSWLNLRNTRFCHACGRTVVTAEFWLRPGFCPHCGAAFDA
jgi:hypothetical protein